MTTWEERMSERAFARALIRAAQPSEEEQLQERWREWVYERDGWGVKITAAGEYVHVHESHTLFYPPTDGSIFMNLRPPVGRCQNRDVNGSFQRRGLPGPLSKPRRTVFRVCRLQT